MDSGARNFQDPDMINLMCLWGAGLLAELTKQTLQRLAEKWRAKRSPVVSGIFSRDGMILGFPQLDMGYK